MYKFIQRLKKLFVPAALVVAGVTTMHPAGLDLLKLSEGGCYGPAGAECAAYIDPVGELTIGYGHTMMANTLDFTIGDTWTEEFATDQLDIDIRQYWDAVDAAVTVPLNQCQLSVLTVWTYNVGQGAMRSSTLVRLLNQGDYGSVPSQLARWNKGGGRVLRGLVTRRAAEGALWTDNCGEEPL